MDNTNKYSGPYPTIEQQIQIDGILSRKFHEEEQAQFRERNKLINKKSAEHSDQKRTQPITKQTEQTGNSKLKLTTDINSKRQEQNNNDHRIQLDPERTYEH